MCKFSMTEQSWGEKLRRPFFLQTLRISPWTHNYTDGMETMDPIICPRIYIRDLYQNLHILGEYVQESL